MKNACVEPARICNMKRKIEGQFFCALPRSYGPPWFYPKGKKGFDYTRKICSYDREPGELDLLITGKIDETA